MAYIILPSKRTRQPNVGVRLAPQFSYGIAELAYQKNSLLDGGTWTTFGTAPTYDAGSQGLRVNASAAFGGLYKTQAVNLAQAAQAHLFYGEVFSYTGAYAGLICSAIGDGTAVSLSINRDASNAQWELRTYAGALATGSTNPITNAGPVAVLLQSDGTTCSVWVNGKLFLSAAGAGSAWSSSRVVLFGERTANSGYATKGVSYLRASWGRGFSSAEAAAITANPWSIFAPEVRRIYFGAGAGGGTQSGTTDEATSAADTPTAVSTRLASTTETGSAADTPTAVETTLASVAETTSAADTPSAVSTRLAAVAESGSAADTTDATATGASTGTVAETASATDTPTAVSTLLAATAETGTATDTPTAVETRLAAVAESTSATESTNGTVVPAGASDCAETASATDAVTCVIVTSGSIAEGTASATDVCAAGGIWADFVAEVATAVATQYVIEPISGIAPDVSKVIDNSASRLGSAAVDRDSARLGSPTGTLRRPRL